MPHLASALHLPVQAGGQRSRTSSALCSQCHSARLRCQRPFTRVQPLRRLTTVRAENTEEKEKKEQKQTDKLVKGEVDESEF
jgi:hypothetical protein